MTRTQLHQVAGYSTLKVGDIVSLRMDNGMLRARITKANRQRRGDLTDGDARKEGFPSLSALVDAQMGYVGYWDPDEVIDVIEFERVI